MTANSTTNFNGLAMTSVSYPAIRISYRSNTGFDETRFRFDREVPLLDPSVTKDLVRRGASWSEVNDVVNETAGPTGFVTISRIDQGSLFRLSGEALSATLYLIGNPIIARRVAALDVAATLYAPFRVVVYENAAGVYVAYDEPSSVFRSLGSSGIDGIALELSQRIKSSVETSCMY